MTAEQTAADLRAAAEVLRRDGWTQGVMHRKSGCHCALGGLATAVSDSRFPDVNRWSARGERYKRFMAARLPLAQQVGVPVFSLADWNDTPGRTAEEVIAALEAAAEAVQ